MSFADPRATAHIPMTAGTEPFTPPVLNPWRQFERDLPLLEAAVKSAQDRLDAHRREELVDWAEVVDAHEQQQKELEDALKRASNQLVQRRETARAEADRIGAPPVFFIKIPTATERDMLNSRLVQLGLTSVSDDTMRSSMIEAIYEIDWCKEVDGIDDLEAYRDDLAAWLDGYWQREAVQVEAQQTWHKQQVERLLDIAGGAPVPAPDEMPARLISPRDVHKARLLGDRLIDTPRLRKLLAKKLDFSRRNAQLLVQMHLVKVMGIEGLSIVRDARDDALDPQSAIDLRETLERLYGKMTGEQAWIELVAHIDRLYSLDEFEAGNSASPPEKPSDRTGSDDRSGAPASSDGNSTESNIAPALDAGSGTITDNLCGTGSGAIISTTSLGPTVVGGPVSRFDSSSRSA